MVDTNAVERELNVLLKMLLLYEKGDPQLVDVKARILYLLRTIARSSAQGRLHQNQVSDFGVGGFGSPRSLIS